MNIQGIPPSVAKELLQRSELVELREFVRVHGYKGLASHLGVPYQNIQKWIDKGMVPPKYLARTEGYTGIPRYMLNPEPFVIIDDVAA